MIVRALSGEDIDVGADVSTLAFDLEVGSWRPRWQRQHRLFGPEVCWGVFDGGALVSSCVSAPRKIWFGRKAIPGGFVGGVATHPEHRRQGFAEALMAGVVKAARDRGTLVNFLWPFSFRYYRKCGWDIASDITRQLIDTRGLAAADDPAIEVRDLTLRDVPELMALWSEYSANFNGLTDRPQVIWTDFMADNPDAGPDQVLFKTPVRALGCWEQGRMTGYAKLGVEPDKPASISEMAHTTGSAVRSLLREAQALGNQEAVSWAGPSRSAVHTLLDEPRNPPRTTEAGCMARVIDPSAILTQLDWPEHARGDLDITVIDPFFGSESFGVNVEGGAASLARRTGRMQLTCTVQLFTQLVMGYLSPESCVATGAINRAALDAARLLALASGGRTPYRSSDEPG